MSNNAIFYSVPLTDRLIRKTGGCQYLVGKMTVNTEDVIDTSTIIDRITQNRKLTRILSTSGWKDSNHQLETEKRPSVYQLRTGHCQQHLRKHRLHPTALCECGLSDSPPEHILQTYLIMTSRQHVWTELTTQALGQKKRKRRLVTQRV
jgi:hypothetical protein